jgi:hypothetical protein
MKMPLIRRSKVIWDHEDEAILQLMKMNEFLSDIFDELQTVRGELESIRNSAEYIRSNTEHV